MDTSDMDMGPQPIDALLAAQGLKNHDIVAADDSKAVTHKVVGKARKGRRLTARMQRKILGAVNSCLAQRDAPSVSFDALFNYVGP